MCDQLLSCVWLSATPWTIAHQALLSLDFSRQEYWSGKPFSTPGGLPNPGIEPVSPALVGGLFTTAPPGKPYPLLIVFLLLTSPLVFYYFLRQYFRGWNYQVKNLVYIFSRISVHFAKFFRKLYFSLYSWQEIVISSIAHPYLLPQIIFNCIIIGFY